MQYILKTNLGYIKYSFGAGVSIVPNLRNATVFTKQMKENYGEAAEMLATNIGETRLKWKQVVIIEKTRFEAIMQCSKKLSETITYAAEMNVGQKEGL